MKPYLSVHEMDIIYLSETYLDSSAPIFDDNWQIPGYGPVRADYLSGTKWEGVLICYKGFLRIKLINVKYLYKSLNLKLTIGGKDCFCLFIDCLVKKKMILNRF